MAILTEIKNDLRQLVGSLFVWHCKGFAVVYKPVQSFRQPVLVGRDLDATSLQKPPCFGALQI